MRNLEQLIAEWRKTIMTAPGVGPETLDELENHLRETLNQLVRSGITEAEAFQRAVTQLGSAQAIASEFQKLNPTTWLPVKVAIGIGVAAALALPAYLLARFEGDGSNFLLVSHVFLVTLGYLTVYLTGALGICFICQRCYTDLSPDRLQSLSRVIVVFARVAACLTAAGMVLGMIWARAEWGRFWAWDPKEIGVLCVVVWLIGFLSAHRSRRTTARGVLVVSAVGNIVVSLAWFGANQLAALHSYGTSNDSWFLLAMVIGNLAVFLIGLAPAGWLRFRKAAR